MRGTSAGGWAYGPQYHLVYIGWSTRSYHSAVSCQSVQIAGNGSIYMYSVVGGRMASLVYRACRVKDSHFVLLVCEGVPDL